ncbi:MAG TPA: hypothetical protein VJ844_01615, partial [Mucilaginibacter sp.]|nr:hypothetical protein [Mucilaginibacter sp.]
KVITYPYKQVVEDIEELLTLNKHHDDVTLVNKMKDIVPEFISKNSHFEFLDNISGDEEEIGVLIN